MKFTGSSDVQAPSILRESIDPNHPNAKLFSHHGDLSSTEWILNLIYSRAGRIVSPCSTKPRKSKFRHPRIHGRYHRLGHYAVTRGHSSQRDQNSILPSLQFGDVWLCSGAAKRNNPISAAKPLRGRQGLRPLDDTYLSRRLWLFCGQRYPV